MRLHRLLSVILIACFLIVGCGAHKATPSAAGQPEYLEVMSTQVMHQIDNQRPDRKPDYLGKVKSVSGDKITLALAEIPARPQLSPEEIAKRREQPEVQGRQGMMQTPPQPRIQLKFTGKTKDLIIPAGTRIVRFSKDCGKPTVETLEMKDIKEGTILKVWVEGEKVVYVQVSRRQA